MTLQRGWPAVREQMARNFMDAFPIVLGVLCALFAGVLWFETESISARLVATCCIGVVSSQCIRWAVAQFLPTFPRRELIRIVATIVAIALYVGTARASRRWKSPDGETRHIDTGGWFTRPTYRRSASRSELVTGEGPISPSGKPHGRWLISTHEFQDEQVWFWYGEVVKEGEWHLRNK